MPYVQRDARGRIVALLRHAGDGAEHVDREDAELLAFLGEAGDDPPARAPAMPVAANDESDVLPAAAPQPPTPAFDDLDRDFVRVLEDVVDALIARGVIAITDLPVEARSKLLSRKSYRERVIGSGLIVDGDDMDEAIGRGGFDMT